MVHSCRNWGAGRAIMVVIAVMTAVLATPEAQAVDPSEAPIAVRWWGGPHVTIETWWGLSVAINPTPETLNDDNLTDLTVVTTSNNQHTRSAKDRENAFVVSAVQQDGVVREFDLILDRLPNDPAVTLTESHEKSQRGPHPIRLYAFPASDSTSAPNREPLVLLEADGVSVLYCGALRTDDLSEQTLNRVTGVNVLVIPIDEHGKQGPKPAAAAALVARIAPSQVVPLASPDSAALERFVNALDLAEPSVAVGNTLAATGMSETSGPSVHLLKSTPWAAPEHIQEGLEAMRNARASFESVITTLSAEQLDHQPSNGTHTVRWNAEHTAGAELYFFSFVFRDADDAFPVIRATPAQQPADYVAGHPDWTPMEEAAHLQRTGAFVERFAYLLVDVDPEDERYPTFFKSLDGLFTLLEGHYNKHQHNVEAKFSLADWPKN